MMVVGGLEGVKEGMAEGIVGCRAGWPARSVRALWKACREWEECRRELGGGWHAGMPAA